MNLIFAGPSFTSDPDVFRTTLMRAKIAQNYKGGTLGNEREIVMHQEIPAKIAERYGAFLQFLEKSSKETIDEVRLLTPPAGVIEQQLLGLNRWQGAMDFGIYLDETRDQLKEMLTEDSLLHVDIGDSLASLYLAYFATQEAVPVAVAFHPLPEPLDGQEPRDWAVGTGTEYGRQRSNLRRHLLWRVMRRSQFCFIPSHEIGAALASYFPQQGFRFGVDPFIEPPSTATPLHLVS